MDVYNALLPSDGELSATLFIEITDSDDIERGLDAFQGIDHGETVTICAGPSVVYGQFESGHSKKDKLNAVHCVKFSPSPEWIREVTQKGTAVSIRIDHPAYRRGSHRF